MSNFKIPNCNKYKENIDNKVIQIEGEIYWEAKQTRYRFGSNEPSSGLF